MRKRIGRIAILLSVIVIVTLSMKYYYQNLMHDVQIVQYFDSIADNLNWQTVYVRAVVPEDSYRGDRTMNAIRIYVIIRSKNVPNFIHIVLYDSMEKLSDCKNYVETTFNK